MVPRQVIESQAADQLTPLQKGALRGTVCDAIWTKERLLAVGCIFDSTCELCSLQPDTLFHWLWECVVVDEERKKVAPQHLIEEARRLGPSSAAFCKGICADLAATVPHPLNDGGILFTRKRAVVVDPGLWALSGDVFYSGSASSVAAAESVEPFGPWNFGWASKSPHA